MTAKEEQQPLLVVAVDKDLPHDQDKWSGAAKTAIKGAANSSAAGQKGHGTALQGVWNKYRLPLIIAYYALCCSTLIVINKVVIHFLRAPIFILVLQMLFAAVVVRACSLLGLIEAEGMQWRLVQPFAPVAATFLGTLFANIKVLEHSNLETFITFQSSTPLVLSISEYFLMGRELPHGRAVFGMVLPLIACVGYTYYDEGFKIEAYTWLLVWYAISVIYALYMKFLCDTVHMTNWGRVYYTNGIAGACLLAIFPFCKQEHSVILTFTFTPQFHALLALSCVVGVCMSHSGYLVRSTVSATAIVVISVVCKLASVLINLLIWEHHGSPIQLFFLTLGLIGGSTFKQAPLRAHSQYKEVSQDAKHDSNSSAHVGMAPGGPGGSTSNKDKGSKAGATGGKEVEPGLQQALQGWISSGGALKREGRLTNLMALPGAAMAQKHRTVSGAEDVV